MLKRRYPLSSSLYLRFQTSFVKILSTFTCLHFRIIRLHLVFYSSNLNRAPGKKGHITRLWINTYYALQEAISRGHLLEHPDDNKWLFLPNTDPQLLKKAFSNNSSTYRIWQQHNQPLGSHSHSVVRHILAHLGFRQPTKTPTFQLTSGKHLTPDAFTLTPIPASFEVKNGLSEIWPDPRIIDPNRLSDDHIQILNHFQMCQEHQLTPAFIGIKFDPSFYDFVADNRGLSFELGFQIFPPHVAPLSKAIACDLGFRNIVLSPEDPPYPPELNPFLRWLKTLKQPVTP